jgi:hypothetical protein
MRVLRRAAVAALIGAAVGAAQAQAAAPLNLGFYDGEVLSPAAAERATSLDRASQLGAKIVMVPVDWVGVAPSPPTRDAGDPGNPAYDWHAVDSAVRDAAARHLSVVLAILTAPPWAEGANRPASAPRGSWRPSPTALASFARAAARRYSGSYPDPATSGARLPAVRYWQPWWEPNLSVELTPQWVREQGRLVPSGPRIYRQLLNAMYGAVKGVARANVVVTAGTSPFGDPPGGDRMRPVQFARELLCLQGSRLRPAACRDPAHFDVFAHHPYSVGGPRRAALNADDAAVPDMYKFVRLLRAAERTRRALPQGHKRLWVTEMSWDSFPPDPGGIPVEQHARWLEDAFFLLWRQGVDTILWFGVRDQAPNPDYASTNQSGVLFRDGSPKPAATAYRFPFVAERVSSSRVRVWGLAPRRATVLIKRRSQAGPKTIAVIHVGRNRVFDTTVPLRGRVFLHAVGGGLSSLEWLTK